MASAMLRVEACTPTLYPRSVMKRSPSLSFLLSSRCLRSSLRLPFPLRKGCWRAAKERPALVTCEVLRQACSPTLRTTTTGFPCGAGLTTILHMQSQRTGPPLLRHLNRENQGKEMCVVVFSCAGDTLRARKPSVAPLTETTRRWDMSLGAILEGFPVARMR